MSDNNLKVSDQPSRVPAKSRKRSFAKITATIIAAAILAGLLYAGYAYSSSPSVIREPKLEHYHFRMQIIIDGKAENFADQKYQQEYIKNQCSIDLPSEPIHFHDNKDQFVHIHWDGITGGIVFKNYGWNYIGGMDDALGYKVDELKNIRKIEIYGDLLPTVPQDSNYYIYAGDEKGYVEKSFENWINQDLEDFFGKESTMTNSSRSLLDTLSNKLFPTARAHEVEDHTKDVETNHESDEQRLVRINNLVGNVVIFVQNDTPSDEQIKARFNNLVQLSESTCGG